MASERPSPVQRTTSHEVQRDVEDFHRALGLPTHDTPAIRRPELRAELIREEAEETVAAILRGDLIEALDGCCDLLAVVYGTFAEFGVDAAPFWDEVHRTNMAKVGGPVREDGKRLKPFGWRRPQIQRVLQGKCPASYYPHVGHHAGAPFCDLQGGHEGDHEANVGVYRYIWRETRPRSFSITVRRQAA